VHKVGNKIEFPHSFI